MIDRQATYLRCGAEAVIHDPTQETTGTGVVLLPPFGFEDIASHRGRWVWANQLAAAGHPCVRVGVPGTGDSTPDLELAERLDDWSEAVLQAVELLRRTTGTRRVAAMGMGLGGQLAYLAAARGAGIDDIVLWAVPSTGRKLLRQLRAFAGMLNDPTSEQEDGSLWVHGYSMRGGMVAELEALDLTAIPIGTSVRRALVLGRDRTGPEQRLLGHLAEQGLEVTVEEGEGYAAMVETPQTSVAPAAVISTVLAWLGDRRDPRTMRSPAPVTSIEVTAGVHEQVVMLPSTAGRMAAVTTTTGTSGDLCLLLLNSGLTRRTGPSGLWAKAAREAATRGAVAARLDLPGIGDSDGPDVWSTGDAGLYESDCVDQVRQAMDHIAARTNARRFLLVGLCSGAYWGFELGQSDQRVAGTVMLNPRVLVWQSWLTAVGQARDLARLRRADTWRKVVTGRVSIRHAAQVGTATLQRVIRAPTIARYQRAERSARASGGDAVDRALDRLCSRHVEVTMVFSPGEPILEDMQRQGRFANAERWPNLRVVSLDGPPDVHLLTPPGMQREVLDIVGHAVARLIRPPTSTAPAA